MLEKGSFVVNASNGICEIGDIVTMDMTGTEKEYYVLDPVDEKKAKAFLPVDTAEKRIRPVMSKEDALKFIQEIREIELTPVKNEKEREKIYKEAVNSREPRRLISIMKTIYIHRKKRLENGRKSMTVDDKYFKLAESQLYSELAFVLGVEKMEVNQIIEENIW